MNPNPSQDPLHNLADALSEDILDTPAERLLAEAAEEHGDERGFVSAFDRITARAARTARWRRIASRVGALAASVIAQTSWKPVMAASAALAVVVIAGDLYVHMKPSVVLPPPVAATSDSVAAWDAAGQRMSYTAERKAEVGAGSAAVVPAAAVAPPATPVSPPPAPAEPAAGGAAIPPKPVRSVDIRADSVSRDPAPAAAPVRRSARADQTTEALAAYERAKAIDLLEKRKAASVQPQRPAVAIAAAPVAAPAPAPETTLETRAGAAPGIAPLALAERDLASGTTDEAPSFVWPLRGRVMVTGQPENGIDVAAPQGADIRAAEGGVVAFAGDELKGFGNLIILRHRDGFVTAYAHASKLLVKAGDTVRRGQVIAKVGQTGGITAPRLHFEIRKGSTPIDPMQYLPKG